MAPLRIIRRSAGADPLADVPDADSLRTLLEAMRDPRATQTERLKARRHLSLHVQVMKITPARRAAVEYLEKELETPS